MRYYFFKFEGLGEDLVRDGVELVQLLLTLLRMVAGVEELLQGEVDRKLNLGSRVPQVVDHHVQEGFRVIYNTPELLVVFFVVVDGNLLPGLPHRVYRLAF